MSAFTLLAISLVLTSLTKSGRVNKIKSRAKIEKNNSWLCKEINHPILTPAATNKAAIANHRNQNPDVKISIIPAKMAIIIHWREGIGIHLLEIVYLDYALNVFL